MCVNCFAKAIGQMYKSLTANSYDDFKTWPVDFRWDEVKSQSRSLPALGGAGAATGILRKLSITSTSTDSQDDPDSNFLDHIRDLPRQLASYVLAHSLGRWLVYPGSLVIATKALLPGLLRGQALLQDRYKGQRAKLLACDGNEIDTMLVDRRKCPGPQNRGLRLVICCEGNAGFYETGCLSAPLEAGYSVLGWNHPGFAGSSGVPSPQNDANAMDVVVKYALYRLRFSPEQIVIYGWSLGTFTATWATMTYPQLGALILDAPFDDLMPLALALKLVPAFCKGLVERTVREYFHLNVADQLFCYPGPVLLIRRTMDEVVNSEALPKEEENKGQDLRPADLEGNRGNYLLLKLLEHRYPKLMTDESMEAVRQWLHASNSAQEAAINQQYCVDARWCLTVLHNYRINSIKYRKKIKWKDQTTTHASNLHGPDFPWDVGADLSPGQQKRLAIFLAQKYLKNVEAPHSGPLSAEAFQLPWTL
ncbi:protein ABHD16B [Monodelphis domestica]|uniref:Abhydrolase domain containing 16B n=1 Tax=Monodelphis domestica TaxID=13616 RepID=F6TDM5_MONDO|nr:protein ABHD16B [Monodelphis domestica]